MQIVIEISDEDYKDIIENGLCGYSSVRENVSNAIKVGTPLSKNHGRLIDGDELYGDFIDGTEGYDCQTWNRIEIGDIIEDAPTIIEGSDAE